MFLSYFIRFYNSPSRAGFALAQIAVSCFVIVCAGRTRLPIESRLLGAVVALWTQRHQVALHTVPEFKVNIYGYIAYMYIKLKWGKRYFKANVLNDKHDSA